MIIADNSLLVPKHLRECRFILRGTSSSVRFVEHEWKGPDGGLPSGPFFVSG
ncbi:hypothetical protein ACFOYU_17280 [Microvirga sp. GCM10011540]|uniref:hypothetical protein n=1 Tax=Microvirga sp. GCM10011540 TaxID=3317338 RepID=UPI003618CCC1